MRRVLTFYCYFIEFKETTLMYNIIFLIYSILKNKLQKKERKVNKCYIVILNGFYDPKFNIQSKFTKNMCGLFLRKKGLNLKFQI